MDAQVLSFPQPIPSATVFQPPSLSRRLVRVDVSIEPDPIADVTDMVIISITEIEVVTAPTPVAIVTDADFVPLTAPPEPTAKDEAHPSPPSALLEPPPPPPAPPAPAADPAPALRIHINVPAIASILGDYSAPPLTDGDPTITVTDHKKPHHTPVVLSGLINLGLTTWLDAPKSNKHPRDDVASVATLVARAEKSLTDLGIQVPVNVGLSDNSLAPIFTPRAATSHDLTKMIAGKAPRPTPVDLAMDESQGRSKPLAPRSLGVLVARDKSSSDVIEDLEPTSSLASPKIVRLCDTGC